MGWDKTTKHEIGYLRLTTIVSSPGFTIARFESILSNLSDRVMVAKPDKSRERKGVKQRGGGGARGRAAHKVNSVDDHFVVWYAFFLQIVFFNHHFPRTKNKSYTTHNAQVSLTVLASPSEPWSYAFGAGGAGREEPNKGRGHRVACGWPGVRVTQSLVPVQTRLLGNKALWRPPEARLLKQV